MTIQSFPVPLLHRPTKTLVEAQLQTSIEAAQLADWRNLWIPEKIKGFQKCCEEDRKEFIPGSCHWNWERKIHGIEGLLAKKGFSVLYNGRTEGLMLMTTPWHAQEVSQRGKPLVYIDYIEVAPWNLKGFISQGEYSGIGTLLLGAAIQLSHQEGFQGRIGLHSLLNAESFYQSAGMLDIGIDPSKEGLRYFEMTPQEAKAFLS